MEEWRNVVSRDLQDGLRYLRRIRAEDPNERQTVDYVVNNYAKYVRGTILQHSVAQEDGWRQFAHNLSTIEGLGRKLLAGFTHGIEHFGKQEDSAVCDMMGVLIELAGAWTESSASSASRTTVAMSSLSSLVAMSSALGLPHRFSRPEAPDLASLPEELSEASADEDPGVCEVGKGVHFNVKNCCPKGHLLLPRFGGVRACDGCGHDPIHSWELFFSCLSCGYGTEYDLCAACHVVPDGFFEAYVEEKRGHLHTLEHTVGPKHAATLRVRGNLALALQQQGKLEAALVLQQHNLEVASGIYEPDHEDAMAARLDVALTLRRCYRFEESARLKRLDLEILEHARGPGKCTVARRSLSLTFCLMGQLAEAERLARLSLAIVEGPTFVNSFQISFIVAYRVELAMILCLQGHFKEAETLQKQALEDSINMDKRSLEYTIWVRSISLAICYQLGHLEAAEWLLLRSLEVLDRIYGTESEDTTAQMLKQILHEPWPFVFLQCASI